MGRGRGTVHLDTGETIVLAPPLAPGTPSQAVGGISAELAIARLVAVSGGCPHSEPVEVRTVIGELVAWLCLECDKQLPAEWKENADA